MGLTRSLAEKKREAFGGGGDEAGDDVSNWKPDPESPASDRVRFSPEIESFRDKQLSIGRSGKERLLGEAFAVTLFPVVVVVVVVVTHT